MVVEVIEELHGQGQRLSYRELCASHGVPYRSFMRWKGRVGRGAEAVQRSGPRKVEPLDLEGLREEIRLLQHGRKRTTGTGDLYQRRRGEISRRQLQELVNAERVRKNRERDRIVHQVKWKIPRLIWAMDDTEYHPFKAYPKAYLHNLQDLGSRYKMDPLVNLEQVCGEEVAANLSELFDIHGPPLFLKRDNGGNLNHHLVDDVLEAALVIPVNSPCYYPQYNGGIEAAQRQIKQRLIKRRVAAFLAIQAGLEIQELNHTPMRCLQRRTPCQVFCSGQALAATFTRRKRREVYDWIREKTLSLVTAGTLEADAAWRLAVETWLLDHGFISVVKGRKVSPGFP